MHIKMDKFDEVSLDCGDENSNEIDITIGNIAEKLKVVKESPFEILTVAQIEEIMDQYIEDVKSVVPMPDLDVRFLVCCSKNKEELLLELTNENRDESMVGAKVTNPFASVACTNCSEVMFIQEYMHSKCGHKYCTDCYRNYLTAKISDVNATVFPSITCPAENCDQILNCDFISTVIIDENVRQKYRRLLVDSFVQNNHWLMRWCPAPNCDLAIRAPYLLSYQQNCVCDCGQRFCFSCGDESHDPLPCNLISKWKQGGYDETLFYLTVNTKSCPRCTVIIEKDGGGNCVKCKLCDHEFCWKCNGEWGHSQMHENCLNDGAENEEREQYWMYVSNKISLKCEQELLDSDKIEDHIRKLQRNGVPIISCRLLTEAVGILCGSRKQLILSYIFSFSVEPNNHKRMAEMTRKDLQLATDRLSAYLEHNMKNDHPMNHFNREVKSKAKICEGLRNALDDHIYDGFENDLWTFKNHW